MPTPQEWHERFQHQARWTGDLRRHYFSRFKLASHAQVLEVGCGTGAATANLVGYAQGSSYGLDLNYEYLRLARANAPETRFTAGDALRLPFSASAFDIVFCHFFLLWIKEPGAALAEMARVTRPGGWVLAFAEPDYGGRIDYPPPLDELGRLQAMALQRQGAEPQRGRQLAGLFHTAGLREIETGVLGGRWQGEPELRDRESEWQTIEADLGEILPDERLAELRRADDQAWRSGERVLFVPTFYAAGRRL